jgi:hypothetical protein
MGQPASIRNATTGAGSPDSLRTAYAALEGPLFHGSARPSDDARGVDSRLGQRTREDGAASFVRAVGRGKGFGQEWSTYRGGACMGGDPTFILNLCEEGEAGFPEKCGTDSRNGISSRAAGVSGLQGSQDPHFSQRTREMGQPSRDLIGSGGGP